MGAYNWIELAGGQRMFVLNAEEYGDECTILAAGVDLPTDPRAELVEGQWILPLPALKADKKEAVKAAQAATFLAGWSHDFGAAGVHALDVRNPDDKANWTLLLIKTQAMIAAGAGAAPVEIRTAANVTIQITATEANAAMVAFLAWGEAMLRRKWEFDALVDAVATLEDLAAIDLEAGWPA